MRRQYLVIGLLLIVLPVAVFWRTQYQGFVWDDSPHIKTNPYLNPVTLPNVLQFWRQSYDDLYIPLAYTVWAGIARLSGSAATERGRGEFDPRPFHIANLILHLCSTVLVFIILQLLVQDEWGALGGALLFALHPLQVEPVAWISGMRDLLSGFWSFVAIWQYLIYAKLDLHSSSPLGARPPKGLRTPAAKIDAPSHKKKLLHYALATLAFLLALLAKPSAVALPVAVWVLDCWVIGRPLRRSIVALVAWVSMSLLLILLTKLAQPGVYIAFVTPLWARPLIAADALAFYLYKLVLPIGLGPDYGRSAKWVFQSGWMHFGWLVPCALAVIIWSWRRRWPWLITAAGVFAVGILAVSGLVPFGFQNVSTVADRYVYLAMLGPAVGFAGLLAHNQATWVKCACAAVLALFGVMSFFQTQHWSSDTTLFRRALDINPTSWVAHLSLGTALAEQEKNDEAVAHYKEALRLNPNFNFTRVNLGNVLANQNKLDEAIVYYREAVRLSPDYADAHKQLANGLFRLGELKEAVEQYRLAIKLEPRAADAHFNLALTLTQLGEQREAIEHFGKTIAINPAHARAHYNLGALLANSGQLDQAAEEFRAALKINPNDAKTHFNLGRIRAQQSRINEAVGHFEEAVKLQPDAAEIHESLAWTLTIAGKKEQALHHYQEALRLVKAKNQIPPAP